MERREGDGDTRRVSGNGRAGEGATFSRRDDRKDSNDLASGWVENNDWLPRDCFKGPKMRFDGKMPRRNGQLVS